MENNLERLPYIPPKTFAEQIKIDPKKDSKVYLIVFGIIFLIAGACFFGVTAYTIYNDKTLLSKAANMVCGNTYVNTTCPIIPQTQPICNCNPNINLTCPVPQVYITNST